MQHVGSKHNPRTPLALALLVVLCVVIGIIVRIWPAGRAGAQAPHIPLPISRIAWQGHVTGSPEPPPPFQAERLFPKLTFKNPTDIAFAPGSNRVFVTEQFGKVWSFPNDPSCDKADLALDLKNDLGLDKVPDSKGLANVFGITFHPQFAKNRYCYIFYSLDHKITGKSLENGTHVSRFTVSQSDPPRIDPKSETLLITWRGGGHNGGCMKFGPDGYLYASAGDAGDPNPPDPYNSGQDVSDLLCSIIRIDVDHPEAKRAYSIPPDNPFVHLAGARPEVYAFGLRNPWRFSFDRQSGNLWCGDVGWELWEMVDRIVPGGNYGWSLTEGPQPVHANGKVGPTPVLKPDLVLPHTESASVTGGYVCRGSRLPQLAGSYVFGDWETRRLWAAKTEGENATKLAPYRMIAQTDLRIVSFGEDAQGELYLLDYEGGGIHRIAPNAQANQPSSFPRKLSETGLFTSVPDQAPAPGVVPFSINAEQWNDGASAERFMAVPTIRPVTMDGDGKKVFPKDTTLVRTFSIEREPGKAHTRRRVETQLLHFDGKRWNGYTYRWNEVQSDADLVPPDGAEATFGVIDPSAPGGQRERTWHYQSRAQCATCHTAWTDYTLAYNEPQLDRPISSGQATENQVALLRRLGLFAAPAGPRVVDGELRPAPKKPTALVDPHDASADVNARARSYLHVNCSSCHRFGGGGSALINLEYATEQPKMNAVGVPPLLGAFGIADPRIIAPGDPGRSVLLYRMAKLGAGRMPHIGSERVDSADVALLNAWIQQLSAPGGTKPTEAPVAEARLQDAAAFAALCAKGGAPTTDPSALPPSQSGAIDRLLSSSSGALTLVCGIDAGAVPAPARTAAIAKGAASAQPAVRELFESFVPPDQLVRRLGENIDPASILKLTGDAKRGREVFFGADPAGTTGLCRQCHQVGGQGESFGPDLSRIGAKYDKPNLLDNILNPSKTIDPQYVGYLIQTTSGDAYVGLLVAQTDKEIVLKDASKQVVRIPVAEIKRKVPQSKSPMPDGLLGSLTAQQAADLVEYLAAQK